MVVAGLGVGWRTVAAMTPTQHSPHPLHTLSRLRAEWEALAISPAALRSARSWQLPIGEFGSLDDVLSAAGMRLVAPPADVAPGDATAAVVGVTAGGAPAGDEVLRMLVVVARTDALAARVVLQRLLPGLSAAARRHGRCHNEHLAAFDELLSVAWGVIREFPVERRNHHLAPALLRDCEHHAFRKQTRRLLILEPTEPRRLDRVEREVATEPLLELCQVIGAARGGHLAPADVALLRLLLSGRRLAEVAEELSISGRSVRNHRSAAVHRLRAAVATHAA